ncbi:MAG: hypothetical protein ACYC7D_15035 [Nitrososphaerales archaeon]
MSQTLSSRTLGYGLVVDIFTCASGGRLFERSLVVAAIEGFFAGICWSLVNPFLYALFKSFINGGPANWTSAIAHLSDTMPTYSVFGIVAALIALALASSWKRTSAVRSF